MWGIKAKNPDDISSVVSYTFKIMRIQFRNSYKTVQWLKILKSWQGQDYQITEIVTVK